MSSAAPELTAPPLAGPVYVALPRSVAMERIRAYVELSKPKIAVMGLFTVAVGFFLGSQGEWNGHRLLSALFGVGLVAISCSVLNQLIERDTDRLMTRTARRPLPSGRLTVQESLAFGLATGTMGLVWLATQINLLTAVLGLVTLLSYVGCYTPLKRWSSLSTVVGAIPGALPPVLGWTAAGGSLDSGAFSLFVLLFLWQFPHFLAIAWLLREQYSAAELRMMPQLSGRGIGLLAVGYALALIPGSLLVRSSGLAGQFYTLTAIGFGAAYLWSAIEFARQGTDASARRVLWASFLYLPLLLAVLTLDHWRLLS
ncbi:MAG: protoheme IX farnesyltransferase [Planctomycetota bacterium]|nr:MAG: protoheme IX farnesyltransferase [Planctomycetota bacterium]